MKFLKSALCLPVLAAMIAALPAHAQQGGRQAPDYAAIFSVAESYEYEYTEQMVDGGDGFKLLTRIYLPKGEGPWPVAVTRTPYASEARGDNNPIGREYAKRGIGYIQQDCRGKGGSEGFYSPNIYERVDGIALYKWLDAQPWCRSIGIFGNSYTALTGWIVADVLPDKVKGLYLGHYGVDRHISCYRAGLFRQDIMSGWVIGNAEEDIHIPTRTAGQPNGENYYPFYRYLPQVEADEAVLGQKLQYYRDWITHTDYGDPYWNSGVWGDLKSIPAKVEVPVTIVAGQFDHHEEGTLLGYERLNPRVKAQSRLVLGSWNHSFQVTPTHVPTDNARDFAVNADQFSWLHSILVLGVVPKGEVKVYAVERDEWINFESWPVAPDAEKRLFLSAERAGGDSKARVLTPDAPADATLGYVYDPSNPVMALGGETVFSSTGRRGSRLQPEPGYRDDVLSFVSAPLGEDVAIVGKVRVVLNVSTDVDDTCFAFTMSEVTPGGEAYNMRTAITTLAYRNDPLGPRRPYTPGEKVSVEIEALPIVWTVRAGNSLRVDVKSSVFPEYAVHTNYAGVWSEQPRSRLANQSLFVGGADGSQLVLPVMLTQ
jgi:putative CocE/NonD family hydrolase